MLVWLYFPFNGWPGTGPCIPLRGHCVLNPRGTIIPDRRPLSLGNRGRGNRSCTPQSTSADDSEDTTDHRKSLCMWGQLYVDALVTPSLWLGLSASKVIQEPPKIRYRRHPRTSIHKKLAQLLDYYWTVLMFRTAAAAAQKRKCKSNGGWKGNLQPTNVFPSSDWNYSQHHCGCEWLIPKPGEG